MKKLHSYGIGFFIILFVCFLPIFAVAPIPPEPREMVANNYIVAQGTRISGNLRSTYYPNDGDRLRIKNQVIWLVSYMHVSTVEFYFPNPPSPFRGLSIDITYDEGYVVPIVKVEKYYTDDPNARYPEKTALGQGHNYVSVNPSKTLARIEISYSGVPWILFIPGPSTYVYIDQVRMYF